jgi:hypothetical protein
MEQFGHHKKQVLVAWASGFFDGEGCFYAHYYKSRDNNTRVFRMYASCVQKENELLIRFNSIVGFGVVYKDGKCWVWKTTKIGEAQKLYYLFEPFLSKKRTVVAKKLIKREENQTFRPKKPHCKYGHKYTIKNTRLRIYRGHTSRICVICRNKYAKEWRKRQL